MKRGITGLIVFAAISATTGIAAAGEKSDRGKRAYLGMAVQSVPPALHSQLHGILPNDQGVLVSRVVKNSPAEKAGMQANDILLSYGDQKLYSPRQLVKLVRGDKPGHQVAVDFVRGGKTKSCKIKLGKAEARLLPDKSRVFRFFPDERMRELFKEMKSKKNAAVWDTFDAMSLKRVDENNWRAEIKFRNKEGKRESKVFTGTRDEIRKSILAEKDLPANERQHLLRALNLHDPIFEFRFAPFEEMWRDF